MTADPNRTPPRTRGHYRYRHAVTTRWSVDDVDDAVYITGSTVR